jgi:uncharacterized membrane protein YfcA
LFTVGDNGFRLVYAHVMSAEIIIKLASTPGFWAILATALIAGVVRGFSGFGTGMIFVPAASAIYSPKTAVVALWVLDSLPTLIIVPKALPHVDWRTVIPAAVGYALLVRYGVAMLAGFDPQTMRWLISLLVFGFVLLLWSGWRYHGARPAWLSAGVGGIAGLFSGAAGLPGPPVIAYWMASNAAARTVRANLIAFFMLGEILSGIALYWADLFAVEAVAIGIAAIPAYVGGLLAGQSLFGRASEELYRRVAFMVILASATLGLPLLDRLLK